MNRFAYKGRDSQGQAVSGVVEAVSELAAAEQRHPLDCASPLAARQ